MRISLVLLVMLALVPVTNASAADTNGDGIDTILIPLGFTGGEVFPGAFGSRWTGFVWLHNRSNGILTLLTQSECALECQQYGGFYTGGIDTFNIRPDLGTLLTPRVGERLTLSARMWETTRLGQPRGIDLPVVREQEFFTESQIFLGVPSDNGVRVGLRVYDPRIHLHRTPRRIKVEVLNLQQVVIASTTLLPRLHTVPPDRFHPGYDAILDLAAAFPVVLSARTVHIRVTPEPAGADYWAMVSVTDNETQTLSIITAQ